MEFEEAIAKAVASLARRDNEVRFIQLFRERDVYRGVFEITSKIPEPTMEELHEYEATAR